MGQRGDETAGKGDGWWARRQADPDQTVRTLFLLRYLSVVVVAIASALVGDFPAWTPFAVLFCGGGTTVLAHVGTRRSGHPPDWLPVVEVLSVLIFTPIAPAAVVPVALTMLVAVAITAATTGIRMALMVTTVGTVGLALEHAIFGLADGVVVLVAFTVSAVSVTSIIGRLVAAEGQVRERLNDVVDTVSAALWAREPVDHQVTFVNQRAITMLGWFEAEWLTPGFWSANIHPEDRDRVLGVVERSIALGIAHEVRYRFRSADGRWVHLHDRASVVVDAVGNPVSLQGMSLDVTDRVEIEKRMSRYADIVDAIDLAMVVLDVERGTDAAVRLSAANPAAARLLNRELGSLIGARITEVLPALSASQLERRLAVVAQQSSSLRVEDLVIQPDHGERRVVTLRAFPLPDHSVGVSLEDVTDAVAASEALRQQALYDGLTGLPNRRALDDELHRVVSQAFGSGDRVALLVMDLDQFKEVNDALGHHVGDELLRGIGDRLSTSIDDALIARLGGDEFAVVMAGAVTIADAVAMAESIRETLATPFLIDAVRLQSNASIGIAVFPDQAPDVASLVQRADVAMYVAKRTGSGVAVYASEQDRSSIQRITLLGDLAGAVADGEFELYYQPSIDVRTGATVRVEALSRWNHPVLGQLQPAQFIELAALSGAIHALTHWAIEEGLRAASIWRAAGYDVGLAVNLSMRNLYDPTLIGQLTRQLESSGVPAEALVLELTETELMDDPGVAREMFTNIGALGINTSIDDFGTGYSSLTYLRDLPLQELKIDRSFVREMVRRSDEFTIVRSMIDLGHNLGLEVVAEGVEHRDDLELLARLGCDYAQGYHISRPMPLGDLLPWLARHHADATQSAATSPE